MPERAWAGRARAWAAPAALIGFALWFGAAMADDRRWLDLGVEAMVLAGVAVGLDILLGSAGLLSLGHAGFFVAGGYAGAVLGPELLAGASFLPDAVVRNGPWLGPLFAAAAGAALGAVLALVCSHLRGFHLTAVTLAFGALVPAVVVLAADHLGGLGGRTVEHVPDTSNAFLARGHTLAGVYYTAAVFLLGALGVSRNLRASRWGRAMGAVRDSEVAAAAFGINPYRQRIGAFAVSAAVVAVGGWVAALRTLSVSSGSFLDVQTESFRYVVTVVAGGVGTLAGPVVAAFGLTFGLGAEAVQEHLRGRLGLVLGALGLAVVALAPGGIVPALARVAPWSRRRPPVPTVPSGRPPATVDVARAATGATSRSGPVLAVRGLTRIYGGVVALGGVDMEVARGSIHALLGPNGSGKSTLVNLVTGVERPDAGRVELNGADVTRLPARRRGALGVARTFQGVRVWGRLSVAENVLAGAHVRGSAGLVRGLLGLAGTEERRLRARAGDLLALVGLDGRHDERAGSLTLAEQRRLEVARALAADPVLVLLDEPAAGLDRSEVAALVTLVAAVRDAGVSVVLVEHRMEVALALADVVTVVHHGLVLVEGPPADVARDPRVVDAYLGPTATGA